MASQTRTSLWRRTRFAVAQEDRVCTCFTRNAAEDCTPLRRRSSLTHHFERSGVEALRGSQTVPGGPTTPPDGSPRNPLATIPISPHDGHQPSDVWVRHNLRHTE